MTDKQALTQIAESLAQQQDALNTLIGRDIGLGTYRGEWEHLRDELARVNGVALRAMRWARG